jgi:hypothetical protein
MIVPECARGRRGEDHVQAVVLGKPSSNAEWRLGIGLSQYGPTVAVDKGEIEPRLPPDDRA